MKRKQDEVVNAVRGTPAKKIVAEQALRAEQKKNRKLIRLPQVQAMVGNPSRSTLWRWVRDGLFPKSYRIGPKFCAWCEDEVLEWIQNRVHLKNFIP